MASFSTDPGELNRAAGTMARLAEEFSSISTNVRQAATGMGSAYDTADNRKFVAQIEGFCAELQRMAEKLEAAGVTLGDQAKLYADREEENSSIANRLPG